MADKRRILIVDDERGIVKMLGKHLEVVGYEVLVATHGEDVLGKVEIGLPNLIILDLMLPGFNGFDVCATLKQNPRFQHIPIIIFTGKGQDGDEQRCREYGADAFVTKPEGVPALLKHVELLLQKGS